MEAHATSAAPSPAPPTSPGDHGGPPGPSGEWTQRERESEDAFRAALEGYASSHRPPFDQVALREAVGSLSLSSEGAYARVAVSPVGDIGLALRATYRCVFGWLGARGGMQVWTDSSTYQCDPALVFERIPMRAS